MIAPLGIGPEETVGQARRRILEAMGKSEADLAADARLGLKVDFFLSSVYPGSRYKTLDEIWAWLTAFRRDTVNTVEQIPVREMDRWRVEEGTGNIRHETGKFFSIEGVRVETRGGGESSWCLPIMDQPEVGILGIIVKKVGGVYYFLMQAKTEPGNIDGYQISPTTQATHSNYTRVHGGKLPPFVDIFLARGEGKSKVLYEGLQSEEGSRFWRKNNLNVIVEVGPEELEEVPPQFCWMTLFQIKEMLLLDNVVNFCARTVLSCLP